MARDDQGHSAQPRRRVGGQSAGFLALVSWLALALQCLRTAGEGREKA